MDGRFGYSTRKFALHRANNICLRLCFDDKIRLLFTGRHFWVTPVVASVIDDIKNEHPDTFMESNGRHTTRNTPVGVADVCQALACRTWIQGQGLCSGAIIDDALRNARSYLVNHCSVLIHKLRLIRRKFYFSGGGALEKQLNQQFTSALCSLGEVLCCDKSCFVYWTRWDCAQSSFEAGKSGYLALSSCCNLPTGDPFLVYTRTHNSSSNLGESTATAEIVKEWAQLIKDYLYGQLLLEWRR